MIKERSFILYVLALCATLLALSACDKLGVASAGGQAVVEGDTLLLPPESQFLAFERAVPKERPFFKFNDRYPGAWPSQVRFPPGVYIKGASEISIETLPNGDQKGKIVGAAQMTARKFAEMMHRQFVSAGWEMGEISLTPGTGVSGAEFPDELVFFGSYKRTKFDKRQSYIVVKVPSYAKMGGWSIFEIEFEYKSIS